MDIPILRAIFRALVDNQAKCLVLRDKFFSLCYKLLPLESFTQQGLFRTYMYQPSYMHYKKYVVNGFAQYLIDKNLS